MKARFQKIFLIMHKIQLYNLCTMLIFYRNADANHFPRLGGEERNPRRPRLSSPPCPVVYNSLRQLHTAGLHPLTILAAASRERN